ncbi:hypothetical protein [Chryseobacterium hagamense]|uniref:hypothetical protein n=1 Tax=Chryseobacterium hagamense TaxID=395935 RepID=UPI0011BD7E9A|nr:hypothetical protein [Chryseobacterium hagamense]
MIISENLLFSYGAELQNYHSGDFIIEEDGTPKYYFQIKYGTVKLSSFLEDGKEYLSTGFPLMVIVLRKRTFFRTRNMR